MRCFAILLAFVNVTSSAAVAADEPYNWAVGPKIGTILAPSRFPDSFPEDIPSDHGLQGVRDDLRLSIDGFVGLSRHSRVGADIGIGLGSNTRDVWLAFHYDHVLLSRGVDVVGGFQAGFGSLKIDGDQQEAFTLPYIPLRARLATQYRTTHSLIGLGVFLQSSVPTGTFYDDPAGVEQTGIETSLDFGQYLTAGLELEIQFGQLTEKKPGPPNIEWDKHGRRKR